MNKKGIRKTVSDHVFDTAIVVLIILIMTLCLYPLIYVVSASVSDPMAIIDGSVWLTPVRFSVKSYQSVFKNPDIMGGYANSILYTVTGTALNLLMTILGAYPLSRRDFRGRKTVMMILTVTMFFSGGLIPTYLVYRRVLHVYNSIWAIILPGAISVWNLVLMRTYFETSIPYELQEAASIDGCNNTRILTSIILPLSKPIVVVLCMYYGVEHWNEYFNSMIYLSDRAKYPLQLILREILIQQDMQSMMESSTVVMDQILLSEGIKYAVIVAASLPMMLLYPCLQKYFSKGVMVGAVKG